VAIATNRDRAAKNPPGGPINADQNLIKILLPARRSPRSLF